MSHGNPHFESDYENACGIRRSAATRRMARPRARSRATVPAHVMPHTKGRRRGSAVTQICALFNSSVANATIPGSLDSPARSRRWASEVAFNGSFGGTNVLCWSRGQMATPNQCIFLAQNAQNDR